MLSSAEGRRPFQSRNFPTSTQAHGGSDNMFFAVERESPGSLREAGLISVAALLRPRGGGMAQICVCAAPSTDAV